MSRTGHQFTSVRTYKTATSAFVEAVSDALQPADKDPECDIRELDKEDNK